MLFVGTWRRKRPYNCCPLYIYQGAEKGDVASQYNLGICYTYGIGFKKDREKAKEWFEKAAKQGHKGAIDIVDGKNKIE